MEINTTHKYRVWRNASQDSIIYIDQEEFDKLLRAIDQNVKGLIALKQNRLINLNLCGGTDENPDWVDPVEDEKRVHYYYLWNKYQELKKSGIFEDRYEREPDFKFQTWYKENKEELDKEYEDSRVKQ